MGQYDQLTNAGWTLFAENPNKEAIAQKADVCLQFTNAKNTIISFMPSTERQSYMVKLAGIRGNDFNYFEIGSTSEAALMDAIDKEKENADVSNYFDFYSKLMNDFDVSILAWEQWESNYR